MKKILLALLLTGLWALPAMGQQYFQNTMFTYTQFGYNPASAGAKRLGVDDGTQLTLMGRLQWLGFEGAPETSYLTYESSLPADAGYFGGMILFDRAGPFSIGSITASYAFEREIGTDNYIRVGVSGGIKQWRLDPTGFKPEDLGDNVLPTSVTSTTVPALATGIYVTGNHAGGEDLKYFAGLSVQNLLEPSFGGALPSTVSGTEDVRTFVLSGGYNFKLDEATANRMSIMPSVLIMQDFALNTPQVTASVIWNYKPIALGLNYRLNESVGATAGFSVSDKLFVGYSYDYPLGSLNLSGDINTHELTLIYRLSPARSGAGRINQDILKDASDN
ncbi:MAG: PorP/SprF family type IX secretion system membrane protein [Bacteroidia bacterium]|nr:PorP/SprF family type IX secretion system membrane protein [Bacteroidia bacterium]